MNKAYDRVRWKFVEWMLNKIGFPAKWRHWIMQCISTVKYSILINGEPTQPFKPKCGLRQGDPVSSYIFNYLGNGVVVTYDDQARAGLTYKGNQDFKINSVYFPYVFFADDSLFYFKANVNSCREIIDRFCWVSGKAINFEKSNIIFSMNTPLMVREELKHILGTPSTEQLGRYLGCNVDIDGRSSQVFQPPVDKVQSKVTTWKHLKQAGYFSLILF